MAVEQRVESGNNNQQEAYEPSVDLYQDSTTPIGTTSTLDTTSGGSTNVTEADVDANGGVLEIPSIGVVLGHPTGPVPELADGIAHPSITRVPDPVKHPMEPQVREGQAKDVPPNVLDRLSMPERESTKSKYGRAGSVAAEVPSDEAIARAGDVLDNQPTMDMLGMGSDAIGAAEAIANGRLEGGAEGGVESLQSILKGLEGDKEHGKERLDAMAKQLSNLLGTEVSATVGADGQFGLDILTYTSDNSKGCFPDGKHEKSISVSSDSVSANAMRTGITGRRSGEETTVADETARLQNLATTQINELPAMMNNIGLNTAVKKAESSTDIYVPKAGPAPTGSQDDMRRSPHLSPERQTYNSPGSADEMLRKLKAMQSPAEQSKW